MNKPLHYIIFSETGNIVQVSSLFPSDKFKHEEPHLDKELKYYKLIFRDKKYLSQFILWYEKGFWTQKSTKDLDLPTTVKTLLMVI